MDFFNRFYEGNYKLYFIVPIIILIASLFLIPYIPQSIDLKGGTTLTIYSQDSLDADNIKSHLETEFGLKEVTVNFSKRLESNKLEVQYMTQPEILEIKGKVSIAKSDLKADNLESSKALLIELGYTNEQITKVEGNLKAELDIAFNKFRAEKTNSILTSLSSEFGVDTSNFEIKEVSPVLGQAFYNNAIKVAITAIILITLIIFLFFHEFVPSLAVVLAGGLDILGALAGMALFGIPLSLITIPALLMLVGYSVDTDIMLTTKLLKRKDGNVKQRVAEAMKTGLTMTMTTMAALIVMSIFAYLYNVEVIFSITITLLFGLVIDVLSTWFMNAPILLWYLEIKNKRKA
jgi:preprotein translocase subunit SecF